MTSAEYAPERLKMIDPATRQSVRERSGGVCECCHKFLAVHMHHLTYARYGHELPADLEHLCLKCHMDEHPSKAKKIAGFETSRVKELEYRLTHCENRAEQMQPEQIQEQKEPAWWNHEWEKDWPT